MTKFLSVAFVVLFLGFPFYWGAFEHPGYLAPLLWAVGVAVIFHIRRWHHVQREHLISLILTILVSLAVCSAVYELGRMLGRG